MLSRKENTQTSVFPIQASCCCSLWPREIWIQGTQISLDHFSRSTLVVYTENHKEAHIPQADTSLLIQLTRRTIYFKLQIYFKEKHIVNMQRKFRIGGSMASQHTFRCTLDERDKLWRLSRIHR